MEIIKGAKDFLLQAAVASGSSTASYGEILKGSQRIAQCILGAVKTSASVGTGSSAGPRIAIMAPPGRSYVEGTWATWQAGGVAVPLCLSHPPGELQYVLEDAQVKVVLTAPEFQAQMQPLAQAVGASLHVMGQELADSHQGLQNGLRNGLVMPDVPSSAGAVIVYTSGTTGKPKGALHTHAGLAAQVSGLVSAWEWQKSDRILHALPLHHVHGIINALYCAHSVGATVEFLPKFSPSEVWKRLTREEDPITVFMGVPTMYSYLLSYYGKMQPSEQAAARAAAARLRLTVSGSAACPLPVLEEWHNLSGQWLLERYGMTETNMILSNPYRGERRPGYVGLPLPGVEVRAVADEEPVSPSARSEASGTEEEYPTAIEGPGELRVRGPNVFSGYINKPEATAEAFDEDGWFRTGDIAVLDGSLPYWRILGRSSVDIIKSGGYKISAPAIENVLLQHERISECAVLGVPHPTLGEAVAAVVACEGPEVSLEEIREFVSDKLPPYQLPRELKIMDAIPRNAMGKINKKSLKKALFMQ